MLPLLSAANPSPRDGGKDPQLPQIKLSGLIFSLLSIRRVSVLAVREVHGDTRRDGEAMSTLMDRMMVNAEQCGGYPCVRGMRIRVSDVLDLLVKGLSPEEFVGEMPDHKL
jgi:hypothetical protein